MRGGRNDCGIKYTITMNTIELTFTITPYAEAVADALMAELEGIGYDGFAYTDTGFSAYIPIVDYHAEALENLDMLAYFSELYRIDRTVREIEDRDWNREWEEHFTIFTMATCPHMKQIILSRVCLRLLLL